MTPRFATVVLCAALLLSAAPVGALPAFPIDRPAPGFAATEWLNAGGPGQPAAPTAATLRGRVTLVEFWTFGCGNCRNVEPRVLAWRKKFGARGLAVVGVHTPELSFERPRANVARYVRDHGIDWPVALDVESATWRRWNQGAWPTMYLVDRRGIVRYVRIGEGAYERTEAMIERLLAEAGPSDPG